MDRRAFLAGATAAIACSGGKEPSETGLPTPTTPVTPPDPTSDCEIELVEGTLLRLLDFLDEPPRDLETTYGSGLDGRRVLDLTTLTVADLALPQRRLFLRTAEPPGLGDGVGWQVRLTGRVAQDATIDIDALLAQTADQGNVHFECSGNSAFGGFGLQGAVRFSGVPWAWVADHVQPDPDGTLIRVRGVDDHPPPDGPSVAGAAWVFRPEELTGAFLATHIDGNELSRDHGWPVRLMVPGWYGCTCIKWLDEIAWVGDDEPATSQMIEFASRTLQDGVPSLARDYAPAEIDVAALPIRVEVWDLAGVPRVRVVGIVWGGEAMPGTLRLWADDTDLGPVTVCPDRESQRTWGLWHVLLPADAFSGRVELALTVDDGGVRTRRLDDRYYVRVVDLG